MHLGLLAAAAHAAATNSRFTIFYNPRASPSEFVIPFTKYVKAVYHTRVSVGMRFRMLFETEESSVRRHMGTITGISDLDPGHWPNSHWRSVKVGWDESTAGERQPRVSLWEIEPLTTFPMYPSPFPLRLKRPWPLGLPSFHGMKDDDLGMNSPLMWLRDGDRGMQAMNFQGMGLTPWMQPRLDASMLGLQSDVYQAMAAAALQEMRTNDPSKSPSSALLQYQQSQFLPNRSAALMQPQMMQQSQSQQNYMHAAQENQQQQQSQSHLIQQQMQHQHSFNSQHQQQSQFPCAVSDMSQFVSSSQPNSAPMQAMSTLCQHQVFSDSNGNPSTTSGISPLHGLLGSFSQDDSHLLNMPQNSSGYPSKRVAVEPMHHSGVPQVEQLGLSHTNMSQNSVTLPPFPGRECSIDQEGNTDPQSHLLFGVNIEQSSLLMPSGMSNLRTVGSNSDSLLYATSNYMNSTGTDFSANPTMTPSSCIDESGFLQSPENVGQTNPSNNETFVKVYKLGSFGRSLDITKFSSYHELRSELGRMFGLEGQLEDPLRSGWQLVFVDRENDVLLLGDDPWQEFVNSVWCIKILSSQEVQQMGKQGLKCRNSVQPQRLSNSATCDELTNRQDSRNLSSGIFSVGSLEY